MKRALRLLAAVALVASAAAACTFPPPEPGAPSLLTIDDWVTGRFKVWDVTFPQGWFPPLYTEHDSGAIFARMSNTERARPMGAVQWFDPTFEPAGEGGLMGISVSPGFNGTTDRRVFVCYSTTADNRVARFDVDYSRPFAGMSNWQTILTGLPHSNIHNGCRVRFQPGTGAMFVSTGDGASGPAPQSATSLGGKILRIDQDGNPWLGNVSGSRWYTRGHRNPQGLAFRPGSNDPYSIEHGPDKDDEVNKLVDGANGGWNPTNGSDYDQSKPMTDPSLTPSMAPVWTSGSVTVAPSGGTFLSGPQWGVWNGALLVACLDGNPSIGQRLLVMHLNGPGTGLARAPVVALARNTRLRTAVQGSDGNLYVVTDGGAVWKVVPT